MRTPKNGFWFASVGGNDPEVIRIHNGKMYSTGCADAHPLTGVGLLRLILPNEFPDISSMKRARLKKEWEQAYPHSKETEPVVPAVPAVPVPRPHRIDQFGEPTHYGYRTFL